MLYLAFMTTIRTIHIFFKFYKNTRYFVHFCSAIWCRHGSRCRFLWDFLKIENHHSFTRCYVVRYCTCCTFGIEQITSQTSFLSVLAGRFLHPGNRKKLFYLVMWNSEERNLWNVLVCSTTPWLYCELCPIKCMASCWIGPARPSSPGTDGGMMKCPEAPSSGAFNKEPRVSSTLSTSSPQCRVNSFISICADQETVSRQDQMLSTYILKILVYIVSPPDILPV